MGIQLDHIVAPATGKPRSEQPQAILGIKGSPQSGPFAPLKASRSVTLDFVDALDIGGEHCAFLVTEREFDAIFERVQGSGAAFCYADPGSRQRDETHRRWGGGRSLCFDGPDGRLIEVLTEPRGASPED